MSDWNFGYSDNSFEDYSWFRNSTGSGEGAGGNGCGSGCMNKVCIIAALLIAIAVLLGQCG